MRTMVVLFCADTDGAYLAGVSENPTLTAGVAAQLLREGYADSDTFERFHRFAVPEELAEEDED